MANSLLLLFLFLSSLRCQDLLSVLVAEPPKETTELDGLIKPIAYDLQLQLPLSEVSDPDTPLFTGRIVTQFDVTREIRKTNDATVSSSIRFSILGLDHFENVSLIHDGKELEIVNVVLTDTYMQIVLGQEEIQPGRYMLSVQRYKGFVGNAIYYRDAGEQAVFGSNFFPHRVAAVMPVVDPLTNKVPISLTIVHPLSTTALSSAPTMDKTVIIDENWQATYFRPTVNIGPSMLALAILPTEYKNVSNSLTGIHLALHYNRYRVSDTQAKKILELGTQVLGLLRSFFSSAVSMAKLDMVIINDVAQAHTYGTLIFPEDSFLGADVANQIHALASQMVRQWIGGLMNVVNENEICLQEDIAEYIAFKVVKRMHSDEALRLAHYAEILLNEDLFEPGHNLMANGDVDKKVATQCGLKGVLYLESIESVVGEKEMLRLINTLVFTSKNDHFSMVSFMRLLSSKVDDGIDLAQIYNFWFRSRGVPNLQVKRMKDTLQLSQITQNRSVLVDYEHMVSENMTLWPLNLEFSDFKLPQQFMISQGILLSPVRESMAMANAGFKHFYRVNYDIATWRQIKDSLFRNTTNYSVRERSQLVADFCHFYQRGDLMDSRANRLRTEFLQLVRLKSEDFPLCDIFAAGCGAGPFNRDVPQDVQIKLRKQLKSALRNSNDFGCGRGAVHSVALLLCTEATGKPCV